jgi:tRNA-2-methylthio-N6-dimethylallyladenosine synthase
MSEGTFHIETHGCQMNIYDSGFIRELLTGAGYREATDPAEADIILINTCSVRERAERKALSRIQELASRSSGASRPIIGITGCMAQRLGERLLERDGRIDLVAGPDSYRRLPALLEGLKDHRAPAVDIAQDDTCLYAVTPARQDGVSAFVTIMRGCNNFCSYCVVPYVRGRERSKPHRAILREVEHLVDLGVREVILIGQNVNSYRDGATDFGDLLEIVDGVARLVRIRFTTSHPKDLTGKVIEKVRDLPKVCEHIHLPLQSGSDRILALMNRGYTSAGYKELAGLARASIPGIAITTDILVGFPSETDEDHRKTLEVIKEVGFESAFMFRYSVRDGTAAAGLPDDVPEEVKIRRLKEVIALQNRLIDSKKEAMSGEWVEILIERESAKEPGFLIGRTRKNWLAKLPQKGVRRGEVVQARIAGVSRWMLTCDEVEIKIGA